MTHYGRGIAYAAMGDLENATRERELYHVAKKTVPPTRKDFPNLISDVLKVADAMLDGEIQSNTVRVTSLKHSTVYVEQSTTMTL